MDLDPTQTGGAPDPKLNPRNAAMAQIAGQVDARQAEDLQDFDEETGEIKPKAEGKPNTTPAQDDVRPMEVEPEPAPVKEMDTIIVDGQSLEVEKSRIYEAGKRTLQKESAADKRLQEANEMLARAKAFTRASPDPAQQPAPSQDAPHTQAIGLDPTQLDTFLENKLYMRDANKAAAKFKEDFPDIVSDPFLGQMAAQLEQKRLDEATALGESFGDPFEAYRKHGETVREWLAKRTGQPAPVDKQERKRTITAVPSTSARAPQPKEDVPKTTSQIIEEQRLARKGRQLVKH